MRVTRLILIIALLSTLFVTFAGAIAPTIQLVYPSNSSTGIPITDGIVNLKVNITDDDGDLAYVAFQTNRTGSWIDIATIYTAGTNWTENMPVIFSGLTYSKTYWWRVHSKDATGNWTNATFSFTTKANTPAITIEILPNPPKAGKNVLFSTNTPDTTGYVFVNETGNLYLVTIKDGLGLIQLSTEEHGCAYITIPKHVTKTFTIISPYEGELSIDMPNKADLNEEIELSVFAKGTQISNTIKMISPSGRETYKTTSLSEPLTISFSESGNWSITTEYYNTVETAYILINPEPLEIEVEDSCCIEANDEVKVTVNADSTVQFKKDEMIWEYVTNENGEVYFTPPKSGRYTITATSGKQTGTEYFYVKSKAYLWVKNDKGYQVNDITEGETLFLQVTDDLGNSLPGSSINIYLGEDQLNPINIPLSGGSAIWKVDKYASTYTFTFQPDDNEQYLSATTIVKGVEGLGAFYIYIAVIIVVIVFIVLYILQKKGIINLTKYWRKDEWEDSEVLL